MKPMTIVTLAMLMAAVLILIPPVSVYAGSLDGKRFAVQGIKLGEKTGDDDTFSFKDGKFYSEGCAEYGFGGGTYMTRQVGDHISFIADTFSDEWGRIAFHGTVVGDSIWAYYHWYNKGKYEKADQIKWFKGTAAK